MTSSGWPVYGTVSNLGWLETEIAGMCDLSQQFIEVDYIWPWMHFSPSVLHISGPFLSYIHHIWNRPELKEMVKNKNDGGKTKLANECPSKSEIQNKPWKPCNQSAHYFWGVHVWVLFWNTVWKKDMQVQQMHVQEWL